ncbi:hypothetical protein LOC54_09175 [Acetobacter sp. AN02]|uniref:hypothetical protein n=1 Tax=Acetobacter sp. AN02 TaxID=2894186 RepID=UPI0024343AC5|nr:hypothetical protein [Acetobacter sp. AN02]MDG6095272.1 hypothetical protein [Acetobacter sp. AN02]
MNKKALLVSLPVVAVVVAGGWLVVGHMAQSRLDDTLAQLKAGLPAGSSLTWKTAEASATGQVHLTGVQFVSAGRAPVTADDITFSGAGKSAQDVVSFSHLDMSGLKGGAPGRCSVSVARVSGSDLVFDIPALRAYGDALSEAFATGRIGNASGITSGKTRIGHADFSDTHLDCGIVVGMKSASVSGVSAAGTNVLEIPQGLTGTILTTGSADHTLPTMKVILSIGAVKTTSEKGTSHSSVGQSDITIADPSGAPVLARIPLGTIEAGSVMRSEGVYDSEGTLQGLTIGDSLTKSIFPLLANAGYKDIVLDIKAKGMSDYPAGTMDITPADYILHGMGTLRVNLTLTGVRNPATPGSVDPSRDMKLKQMILTWTDDGLTGKLLKAVAAQHGTTEADMRAQVAKVLTSMGGPAAQVAPYFSDASKKSMTVSMQPKEPVPLSQIDQGLRMGAVGAALLLPALNVTASVP